MAGWQVGIDIGGTFTDVIAFNPATAELLSAKVKTVAGDPIHSLLAGLDSVRLSWREVDDLVHGTTVVTNAIVEGHSAKVAFVTTAGFADVLVIGRQNRLHLYRLDLLPKLPPQVADDMCFEVAERIDHRGQVIAAPDEEEIARLAETLREHGVEAVAVSLLHAYANAEHEQMLFARLKEAVPHVALSHRINPEAREFERASTTVLSASVMPLVSRYIDRIEQHKLEASRLHFFHSASGLCSPNVVRALPLALALSGPAAGVAAASTVARELGIARAVTFDMGGTTTDVCLIVNGEAEIRADRSLAGRPLRMPAIAVEAIGAGGGSLVKFDGSILQVGPESAGADPGPACYGLGGTRPTVSDADMVLGFLEDGATFGGNIVLSRPRAEAALAPLAEALGLGIPATAKGVVKVANNAMSNALRRVTVDRGVDARTCVLITFGGAGPMHAADVARLIGVRRVIVPSHSGALSALGCLLADFSYTLHWTIHLDSAAWNCARLNSVRSEMRAEIRRLIGRTSGEPAFKWVAAVRYAGQSYAVEIDAPQLDAPDLLGDTFKARHAELYGFATEEPWQVVALRLTATMPRQASIQPPRRCSAASAQPFRTRYCHFDGDGPIAVPEYHRDALAPGQQIEGPLVVCDRMSTLILPPGCMMTMTGAGHLDIDVGGPS